MKIKSLTIYCSHSNNLDEDYYKIAEKVAIFLAKKNITIVYGGGNSGIMGKISNIAMKKNTKVIGIIPEFLKKDENINLNITKSIIVKTMTERKKMLIDKGDAYLILPGGSGTIEEATEVISWKFLELHNKPIIIFNYKNYWNNLINLYNNSTKLNFGSKKLESICIIVSSIKKFESIFNYE